MINIVLYEPEIPENTGNIMRTCAGTNSRLHLIEPLGFVLDEKRIKRSGVNYIDKVEYKRYLDNEDFKNNNEGEYYYFTRYATKSYDEIDFSDTTKNHYLIFGKESTGIPKEILHNNLSVLFLAFYILTKCLQKYNLYSSALVLHHHHFRFQLQDRYIQSF